MQLAVDGTLGQTIGQIEVGGRERLFDRPFIASLVQAEVGESIRLLGYNFDNPLADQDSQVSVTLFWQALDNPAEDYTVFVQVLDAGNQIVAQQDSQPQGGASPTGTWAAGEIVPDAYTLALSASPAAAGAGYRLVAGMYRPATGERLRVVTGDRETDAVTLAATEVK